MAENPLLGPAHALLEARGYVRAGKDQVYERELRPGVTGVVWLNPAVRSRFVNTAPKVGVRHEELTRRVQALLDTRKPVPTTHWQSLRGLHPTTMPPDWSMLISGEDEHNEAFWHWLADQLDAYGEVWMADHADSERMKQDLRSLESGPFSRVTLPVLLWIEGDLAGAREALDWGRSLAVNSAPVLDYDAFAERLLAELDGGR